jgi:CheY-like chemotaxis protein
LETARRFRPDCILSDIGMPGLDGYAFAEKLRENDSFKRTPLVAISAAGDEKRAPKRVSTAFW